MRTLSVLPLALAGLGAALWLADAARRPPRLRGWRGAVAAVLWLALGLAAGVQWRLDEAAGAWPRVRERVEQRAAAALGAEMDALVDRGQRAARLAGAVLRDTTSARPAELFAELERVRRRERISAVAVYDADGMPIAWAGEHGGMAPEAVRRGQQRFAYREGPLFGYVYFTEAVGQGRTAMAAVLLEARLQVSEAPFAARFAGRHGIEPRFSEPHRAGGDAVWDWSTAERPILSVSFAALTQERWWARVAQRGGWALLALLAAAWAVLVVVWYRRRVGLPGLPVAVTTAGLLLLPLGRLLPVASLFSPLRFLLPLPFPVTLGGLLILLLGAAVWVLGRLPGPRRLPPLPRPLLVVLAAVLVPLLLEVIVRSATPELLVAPPGGGLLLGLASGTALALLLYVLLRLPAEDAARSPRRGLLLLGLALAAALGAAMAAWWMPERVLPAWTPALAALPLALLLYARAPAPGARGRLLSWLLAGWVAGCVAGPLLWVRHLEARVQVAEAALAQLGTEPDAFLDFLLRKFAEKTLALAAEGEDGVNLLYRAWVESELAREGYEARITTWVRGQPETELRLSDAPLPEMLVPQVLAAARVPEEPVLERYTQVAGVHYLLLVPLTGGRVVSVVVPPRTRLGRATTLARFLHGAPVGERGDDLETLALVPVGDAERPARLASAENGVQWVRSPLGWRSEAWAPSPAGPMHAHLVLRLPSPPILLTRALLLGAGLLLALTLLWALARSLCGEPFGLARGAWRWPRSFRARLTLALFAFFLIPTAVFGALAYGAASREVVRAAAALVRRAVDEAAAEARHTPLPQLGARVKADLLLFRDGVLVDAAAPEILDLGLFPNWLPPEIDLRFRTGEATGALEERHLGGSDYLVAYRRVEPAAVIAAPLPLNSGEITRRQRELADVLLLMSLLGAALSVVLALAVGRALTQPLEELSRAAAAVGAGNLRLRLPAERSDEFGSVYRAFNGMVRRLRRTRAALVRETRRTELIVAEAATGVLALDEQARVALVNPRARQVLGEGLRVGEPIPPAGPLLCALAAEVERFWRSGEAEAAGEVEAEGRLVRLRLRRLPQRAGVGGAVLAVEDITAEVRTARVLAWGEMARQVAHEIKNPLTPIKLSVQHLRRAYTDQRPDFGEILERNVEAVLREIDRLGEIARAFARFGAPVPAEDGALSTVDVGHVVAETLALYRGGDDGIRYRVEVAPETPGALARPSELKEVLVNLLENAREALHGEGEIRIALAPAGGGAHVALEVQDTGEGIPPEVLARIFEPQFSTRSSGTGLGLAIVRRLVEGWGGEITADSQTGVGTTMHVRLRVES